MEKFVGLGADVPAHRPAGWQQRENRIITAPAARPGHSPDGSLSGHFYDESKREMDGWQSFCALYSGSAGNSYFIGENRRAFWWMWGAARARPRIFWKRCGIDPLAVNGILVTHEHSDHVSGLRVFASKYNIPVFASAGTLAALESMPRARSARSRRTRLTARSELGAMQVQAFRTPHDCAEGLGYRIRTADGRIAAVATDLGRVTPEIEESPWASISP